MICEFFKILTVARQILYPKCQCCGAKPFTPSTLLIQQIGAAEVPDVLVPALAAAPVFMEPAGGVGF